jgi:hypothetical protein
VQSPEAALQRYNWLRTYSSKMPYPEVVREFKLQHYICHAGTYVKVSMFK